MKAVYIALLSILLLTGCANGPEAINFGSDGCSYCRMTISDQRYGAEIITQKGKVYKYDATECMIRATRTDEIAPTEIAQYLVVDISNPTKLIPVEEANFLVSEKLPSPMGANISAFGNKEKLEAAFKEHGGIVYDWTTLQQSLKH